METIKKKRKRGIYQQKRLIEKKRYLTRKVRN